MTTNNVTPAATAAKLHAVTKSLKSTLAATRVALEVFADHPRADLIRAAEGLATETHNEMVAAIGEPPPTDHDLKPDNVIPSPDAETEPPPPTPPPLSYAAPGDRMVMGATVADVLADAIFDLAWLQVEGRSAETLAHHVRERAGRALEQARRAAKGDVEDGNGDDDDGGAGADARPSPLNAELFSDVLTEQTFAPEVVAILWPVVQMTAETAWTAEPDTGAGVSRIAANAVEAVKSLIDDDGGRPASNSGTSAGIREVEGEPLSNAEALTFMSESICGPDGIIADVHQALDPLDDADPSLESRRAKVRRAREACAKAAEDFKAIEQRLESGAA